VVIIYKFNASAFSTSLGWLGGDIGYIKNYKYCSNSADLLTFPSKWLGWQVLQSMLSLFVPNSQMCKQFL
jgi:hypothetical protein